MPPTGRATSRRGGQPAAQTRPGRLATSVQCPSCCGSSTGHRSPAVRGPRHAWPPWRAGWLVGRDDAAVLGIGIPAPAHAGAPDPALLRFAPRLMPTLGQDCAAWGDARSSAGCRDRPPRQEAESRRGAPAARAALLPPVAGMRCPPGRRRGQADPEAARERLRAAGFPRSEGPCPHRGLTGEPFAAGSHPAPPAAHCVCATGWFAQGDRPRRRAVGLPAMSARPRRTTGVCGLLLRPGPRRRVSRRTLARAGFAADVLRSAPRACRSSVTRAAWSRARARTSSAGCGLVCCLRLDQRKRRRSRQAARPDPQVRQACRGRRPDDGAGVVRRRRRPRRHHPGHHRVALEAVSRATGPHQPVPAHQILIMGMGRLEGLVRLLCHSDADVIYVHDPLVRGGSGRGGAGAGDRQGLGAGARRAGPGQQSARCRPAAGGQNGPLIRSLDSYRSYYGRWAVTWEAQDPEPDRWRATTTLAAGGSSTSSTRSGGPTAVWIKPRCADPEAEGWTERLPRGADRRTHSSSALAGCPDVSGPPSCSSSGTPAHLPDAPPQPLPAPAGAGPARLIPAPTARR